MAYSRPNVSEALLDYDAIGISLTDEVQEDLAETVPSAESFNSVQS